MTEQDSRKASFQAQVSEWLGEVPETTRKPLPTAPPKTAAERFRSLRELANSLGLDPAEVSIVLTRAHYDLLEAERRATEDLEDGWAGGLK